MGKNDDVRPHVLGALVIRGESYFIRRFANPAFILPVIDKILHKKRSPKSALKFIELLNNHYDDEIHNGFEPLKMSGRPWITSRSIPMRRLMKDYPVNFWIEVDLKKKEVMVYGKYGIERC